MRRPVASGLLVLALGQSLSGCGVSGRTLPDLSQEPGGTIENRTGHTLSRDGIQRITWETGEIPQVRPAETRDGRLELPTAYPLRPGDAELWATLTRAQQERALAFLQSGSTIRSSLRGDQ